MNPDVMVAPEIDYLALLPMIIVGVAAVLGVIVETFVGRGARRPVQLVLVFVGQQQLFDLGRRDQRWQHHPLPVWERRRSTPAGQCSRRQEHGVHPAQRELGRARDPGRCADHASADCCIVQQ